MTAATDRAFSVAHVLALAYQRGDDRTMAAVLETVLILTGTPARGGLRLAILTWSEDAYGDRFAAMSQRGLIDMLAVFIARHLWPEGLS